MRPLISIVFLLLISLESSSGGISESDSYVEYCSPGNPGKKTICPGIQAIQELSGNQLRANGLLLKLNRNNALQEIIFGYGQCVPLSQGAYLKLLPETKWNKRMDSPFVAVILESLAAFVGFADKDAQISLVGGQYNVFVLNGELRSYGSDGKKLCVAYTSDLKGYNEYQFSEAKFDNSQYEIILGKSAMKKCEDSAPMSASGGNSLKKSWRNTIPSSLSKCNLKCSGSDITIIKAQSSTGVAQREGDWGPGVSPADQSGQVGGDPNDCPEPHHWVPEEEGAPAFCIKWVSDSSSSRPRLGRSLTDMTNQENRWLSKAMEVVDALLSEQKRLKRGSSSSEPLKCTNFENGGGSGGSGQGTNSGAQNGKVTLLSPNECAEPHVLVPARDGAPSFCIVW